MELRRVEKKQPHGDKQEKDGEFGHREDIAGQGGIADAANIEGDQRNRYHHHCRAMYDFVAQHRHHESQVIDHQMQVRRVGGDAGEEPDPTGDETGGGAQTFARVEIRTSGLAEAATHFGKAQGNESGEPGAQYKGQQAPRSGERESLGGKAEDTRAHYAVDGQCGEVIASDGSAKFSGASGHWHRVTRAVEGLLGK